MTPSSQERRLKPSGLRRRDELEDGSIGFSTRRQVFRSRVTKRLQAPNELIDSLQVVDRSACASPITNKTAPVAASKRTNIESNSSDYGSTSVIP